MKGTLIPKEQLKNLPYLYKQLKRPNNADTSNSMKEMPYIVGSIAAIQNDNAELITFYKCISRF